MAPKQNKKKLKKTKAKRQGNFIEYVKSHPKMLRGYAEDLAMWTARLSTALTEFNQAVQEGKDVYGVDSYYRTIIDHNVLGMMIEAQMILKITECAGEWREDIDSLDELKVLSDAYESSLMLDYALKMVERMENLPELQQELKERKAKLGALGEKDRRPDRSHPVIG
jgi:hypothetical protein